MSETATTEVLEDGSAAPDAQAALAPDASAPLPRPRIRVGALLWGLVLTGLGAWVLWTAADRTRREAAREAVLTATPLEWTVAVAIAVGSVIVLISFAAVLRRLQRPRPRA
ncbi:hypothetical protein [Salinibacterium sp. ZJ77]|uniref:hypothetical protein n=1 Tax=Salinibacterium sp. ZJ77 TaxID=2708337 RepID=UPI00141DF9FE|nr:hypothetical protein [Salinibacterium sp. ZJ77]